MINIIICNRNILIKIIDGDKIILPHSQDILKFENHLTKLHLSQDRYVATINDEVLINNCLDNLEFISIRQALNHFDHDLIQQIIYYQQLHDYYINHTYCGRCGEPTTRRQINKFVYCNKCNTENYPHISPCIIVRIHKDDKILMARGVNFPPKSWGLIAGFIEIGESLEDGVMREVKEEINIEIDNLRYWGSQPWPYPNNSLMVGFTASYKAGDITPDKTEIAEAAFYSAKDIPGRPTTACSIASKMIQEFYESQS